MQALSEKMETQRQILLQDYRNLVFEEPWSVSSYYLSQVMLRGTWHISEYTKVLEQPLSLEAVAAEAHSVLKQVQMDILVHGNATPADAQAVSDTVVGAFEAMGATPMDDIPRLAVTKLPHGCTIFEYDLGAENPSQENSCTQNVYQVGLVCEDARRDACVSVLSHIASTSAYQRLRTEEQLGYMVHAGLWAEQNVCGLVALVQGNQLSPREVDERIEAWISDLGRELAEMSDAEFSNYVGAVLSEQTQRYATMPQETMRHWVEIQSRRYQFERLAEHVKALHGLRKDDLVQHYVEFIAAAAPQRRKLSIQIRGTSAAGRGSAPAMKSWRDIRAFQAAGEGFPTSLPEDSQM